MTIQSSAQRLIVHPIAIVLIVGALSACRAGRGGSSDITIDLTPPAAELPSASTLTATLKDASGVPIDGADVTLRGDMTHAGMQPVVVPMQEVGAGTYQTDQFAFNMAGD